MLKIAQGFVAFAGAAGIAGAASAADIYQPLPPIESPIYAPAPIYNWTGHYAGISGGWSWGNSTASTGSGFNIPLNGGVFGGQVGANWMLSNNIVVGIEGDISWTGQSGTITPGPTVTQSLDWLGTIRGRVGVAMNNFMPYVTAGFAAGGGTRTTTIGAQTANATHTGYVLGVGAEWAFAQNWTAKLEYQYVSLGSSTYTFAGPPPSPGVAITDNIFKVGLNYKF
jgi:opacity protein-like surface antigen